MWLKQQGPLFCIFCIILGIFLQNKMRKRHAAEGRKACFNNILAWKSAEKNYVSGFVISWSNSNKHMQIIQVQRTATRVLLLSGLPGAIAVQKKSVASKRSSVLARDGQTLERLDSSLELQRGQGQRRLTTNDSNGQPERQRQQRK